MSEWERHRDHARAQARSKVADAFVIVEEVAGWTHTAQEDNAVLVAAIEARTAVRKLRNLLHPDVLFKDERESIIDEMGKR